MKSRGLFLFADKIGEGPPVLILHGLFGSSKNWRSIGGYLSSNYKVYLLDQRNHGLSPNSSVFDYSSMREDIRLFIEKQSLKNIYLIGHSMGGKVAMDFANHYPSLVKKLVIVDIGWWKYSTESHKEILDALALIDIDNLKNRREAENMLAEHLPDALTRSFVLKNLYRGKNNEFSWHISIDNIRLNIDNIGDSISFLSKIKIPTLFIKGEISNYIKDSDRFLLDRYFLDYEVVVIPQAGHWPNSENPYSTVNSIKNFIGRNA